MLFLEEARVNEDEPPEGADGKNGSPDGTYTVMVTGTAGSTTQTTTFTFIVALEELF
jgi:hypothetical protein